MADNVGIVNEALIVEIGSMASRSFVNGKQITGLNRVDWNRIVVELTGSWTDEK